MVVEQRLAGSRDRHNVRDRAITEAGDGPLVDQVLALKRAQVLTESWRVTGVALEILGEHGPKPAGALQKIHF